MPSITLKSNQILDLQRALLAAFQNRPQMEALLLRVGRRSFAQLEVTGNNYSENVVEAIKTAQDEGWLLRLIEEALSMVPNDPEFRRFQRELTLVVLPNNISAFDVCRLSGRHVMINRGRLRAALREISQPLGKRIVIVKGGPKTGKTHSVQLISYLLQARGDFSLVIVDLEAFSRTLGTSAIIEPLDLARRLIKLADYDLELPDRPRDRQWANWILEFCDSFEARARQDQEQVWLVIDALNSVNLTLTQPTFDLIKELAYRINVTLLHFRLVLLGFDESLPIEILPHVEEEQISPIGLQELIAFFRQAYQELGIPSDELKVAEAVEDTYNQLDPTKSDYLEKLGLLVSDRLAKAATPGGDS